MGGLGARILQGWAVAQRGEATTGIARIRDGLAASEATARVNTPLHTLPCWLRRWRLAEKIEEALAALDDALAEAAVSGASAGAQKFIACAASSPIGCPILIQ